MLFGVDFDYAVDGHSQGLGCFYFRDLPALGFEPTGGCKALACVACLACASISHFFGLLNREGHSDTAVLNLYF